MFAKREGVDEYTFEYGMRFARIHYDIDYAELKPPFSERHLHVYRALRSFDEFQRGVPFSVYKRAPKEPLPEPYRAIIEGYMADYAKCDVKLRTLNKAEYALRRFAEFLCELRITEPDDITATHICDFAATLQDYVATTRNSWLSRVKDFLNYTYTNRRKADNLILSHC
jgi:hypothetical protein